MLTFEELTIIAALLSWTVEEVEQSLAALNDGFMVPYVEFFHGNPETGAFLEPNDPRHDIGEPGFYHRLSADGYMDCTEWVGPFDTQNGAVADLLSMYGE